MQPVSEPVLTPAGWVNMGNISKGDRVIGSDGKQKMVTDTFQHKKKKIYRVTFNDGSYTRCGGEHLWYVEKPYQRSSSKYTGQVLSTDEIIEHGVRDKHGGKCFSIPMVEPVKFSKKKLSINPYILGVILGDGTVSTSGYTTVCTDLEIIKNTNMRLIISKYSEGIGYGVADGINKEMKNLNLNGKRSWEKHIPVEYLTGSIKQRLALLQGLLDTDGHPCKLGKVEFSSTSENLIDGVVELTQSLGGTAVKSKPRVTKYQNGEGRVSWRVAIKLSSCTEPFRLKRKLDKWVPPTKYKVTRYISDISEDGVEDAQCITVDSKDSLYVTRGYILTHNTCCTLTAIDHRMKVGQVRKTLIVAPLRVAASVWETEARKWTHTKHLRFSLIHGTDKKKMKALSVDADVYLINYEGLSWLTGKLIDYYLNKSIPLPFQMMVADEVSCLKNAQSVRFSGGKREVEDADGNAKILVTKGFKLILPHFKYTIGLTGTPVSNGYLDLFGQYLAIDNGERLGKFITHYRNNYFSSDFNGWAYKVTATGKAQIEEKISDITLSMTDGSKYLDLPKVVYKDLMVTLPPKARKHYDELEKLLFTQLDSGVDLEIENAGSLSNKLLQVANANAYTDLEGTYERLHDEKLKALDEVLEEAAGSPVLCSFTYKSDAERIMKYFKKYRPINLTDEKARDTGAILDRWNAGGIRLMVAHAKSVGHGIDSLQNSGSIVVWFGLPWSLELYQQMNARIDRQGQTKPVSIIRILANDTLDLVVSETLENKNTTQEGLANAIAEYRIRK